MLNTSNAFFPHKVGVQKLRKEGSTLFGIFLYRFFSNSQPGLVSENRRLTLQQLLLMHATRSSLVGIKDFLSSSKSVIT